MDDILTHVAGVDVHKEKLSITVLVGNTNEAVKSEYFECKTFTSDLEDAGKKIIALGVYDVVMESTGIYWKPIFNVWSQLGIKVVLANAYHVKNLPGRKTDMKDSEWLAQLFRKGLIRGSFIPTLEFQELRDLTRHRVTLINEVSRVKNRVQKVLENANIKLSSVINDVFGVGGYCVLKAISEGKTNEKHLASLVTTNIKNKGDLEKGLKNTLKANHVFIIKQLLKQYEYINELIEETSEEIAKKIAKFENILVRLDEIPGISRKNAENILAEASIDMESFKTEKHFAAWAGVAPGNNESADKKKELKYEWVIP